MVGFDFGFGVLQYLQDTLKRMELELRPALDDFCPFLTSALHETRKTPSGKSMKIKTKIDVMTSDR